MKYLFCITIALLSCSALFCQENVAEDAFLKYTEAEHASTPEERKKGFNEALSLYLDVLSTSSSGKLYYNIGNCYFQLNEFGFAIYYYYKALQEMPRDEQVMTNLNTALAKVGLPPERRTVFDALLSSFEKSLWVLGFFLFAFCFFSLYIWLPYGAFRWLAHLCLIIGSLLFASLVWQEYFATRAAVVVRTVSLTRGPGPEYIMVGDPLLMGLKVRVIEVTAQGNWIKVRAPSGQEGYVSQENVRVL